MIRTRRFTIGTMRRGNDDQEHGAATVDTGRASVRAVHYDRLHDRGAGRSAGESIRRRARVCVTNWPDGLAASPNTKAARARSWPLARLVECRSADGRSQNRRGQDAPRASCGRVDRRRDSARRAADGDRAGAYARWTVCSAADGHAGPEAGSWTDAIVDPRPKRDGNIFDRLLGMSRRPTATAILNRSPCR